MALWLLALALLTVHDAQAQLPPGCNNQTSPVNDRCPVVALPQDGWNIPAGTCTDKHPPGQCPVNSHICGSAVTACDYVTKLPPEIIIYPDQSVLIIKQNCAPPVQVARVTYCCDNCLYLP